MSPVPSSPATAAPSPDSARRGVSAKAWAATLGLALALVALRGGLWVWFAPNSLDGDEAITGLMARHLAAGRAFPLFFYGQSYLLGLESWLAAPVFALFGSSAYALRSLVLALNFLVAWLLLRELLSSCRLSPWVSLAAASFVLVPAPRTAALLGQAVGMNIEPFLAALLLWRLRRRPGWFGAVFALAFLNREFAAYSVIALLVLFMLEGRLFRRDAIGPGLLAAASFAAVWDIVQVLRPYSTPLGPGSSSGVGLAGSNIARVAQFASFSLPRLPSDLWAMASTFLPMLFGARPAPTPLAAVPGWQAQPWSWSVLALGLLVPLAFVLARSRRRAAGTDPAATAARPESFAIYLLLIGVQAAVVCAAARGEGMSALTLRYVLLALFVPTGIVALVAVLDGERGRGRTAVVAVALLWSALAVLDNARLVAACVRQPPPAPRLELARALEARGVRYAEANYWLAYPVSFLSRERVKVASTDVARIDEYRWLFTGHRDEAVSIFTVPCDGCETVAGVWMRRGRR